MMSQLMTKDVLYEPLKELEEAVSAQIPCHSIYPSLTFLQVPSLPRKSTRTIIGRQQKTIQLAVDLRAQDPSGIQRSKLQR
jgi:Pex19 protein family